MAQGGWGSLLKARYRRIMVLAAGLPLLQQASGINTVVFYSSDVIPGSAAVSVTYRTMLWCCSLAFVQCKKRHAWFFALETATFSSQYSDIQRKR